MVGEKRLELGGVLARLSLRGVLALELLGVSGLVPYPGPNGCPLPSPLLGVIGLLPGVCAPPLSLPLGDLTLLVTMVLGLVTMASLAC